MFKKRNAGDQLLLAVKLNKVSEISRLVALGVNVNSRIDKVKFVLLILYLVLLMYLKVHTVNYEPSLILLSYGTSMQAGRP